MKSLVLLPCIFLITLFGCGGSSNNSTTAPSNPPPVVVTPPVLETVPDYQLQNTAELLTASSTRLTGLAIEAFFEESYLILTERDPESIIADGRTQELQLDNPGLNNISDTFYFQTNEVKKLILEKLLSYDRSNLSINNQLSYDVYKAHLEFELEWAEYRQFEYPATYGFFGWPGSTQSFFTEVLSITNKQDAENYIRLLNQVGRRFSQIEILLDARKESGIIEPAITLGFSQSNVNNIGNSAVTATPYFTSFNDRVSALNNITSAEKDILYAQLRATIEQRVIPAYQQLSQKMSVLVSEAPVNIGFGQFSGGEAFYNFTLRFYTSSNANAEEIHQLGLQELSRIKAEMRVLFDKLGYPQNETIAQLYARVDSDGGTISGSSAVNFYETLIAKAKTDLADVFSTFPQNEVVVIGGNSGGYYIGPSDDGVRPGAFYAFTASDQPYTTMPTLAYHEAIPGHHLQIALAREMDLPKFRRKTNFTSFVEGWGLYAERLAKDLNWYAGDIYGDLGRLKFEAMRASRLVLDTGIHAKGWTYQQAQQFSQDNVGIPGSIARYSVWPGQATAYTTGMLKILQLRKKAQNELGSLYDIKDFHEVVIGNGSMPLNILEGVVDRYIQRKLSPAK